MYGNFILTLLINADSNETMFVAEGQAVDASFEVVRDFTDAPGGGWHPDDSAAGFLGDLLLTSSGLASGDGFDLVVTFEKD